MYGNTVSYMDGWVVSITPAAQILMLDKQLVGQTTLLGDIVISLWKSIFFVVDFGSSKAISWNIFWKRRSADVQQFGNHNTHLLIQQVCVKRELRFEPFCQLNVMYWVSFYFFFLFYFVFLSCKTLQHSLYVLGCSRGVPIRNIVSSPAII